MTARTGTCRGCGRPRAVRYDGRIRIHRDCPGGGNFPAGVPHHWPTYHYGRRVVTIPGPDTWNTKENAA